MHQHGGELWWKVDLIGCVVLRWCWLIMYRSSHWGSFDLSRCVGLTTCGLLSATQVTPAPAFQSNESGSYQTNLMFPFTSFASDDQRKQVDRKFLQPLYYSPIKTTIAGKKPWQINRQASHLTTSMNHSMIWRHLHGTRSCQWQLWTWTDSCSSRFSSSLRKSLSLRWCTTQDPSSQQCKIYIFLAGLS